MGCRSVTVAVVVVVALLLHVAHPLKLELPPGKERCVREEFRTDALVKGEVAVNPAGTGQVCYFKVLHHKTHL